MAKWGTLKKIVDLQVFLGPVLSGISASEWLVYGFLRLVEVRVSLLGHGYDLKKRESTNVTNKYRGR